jgi:hypothetical protein
MKFTEWMRDVDIEMEKIAGLSSECIADYGYRECFDDGIDPIQAAQEALEAAGYDPDVIYYR